MGATANVNGWLMSPLTRGAWIEIVFNGCPAEVAESPLTRGAWIEIWLTELSGPEPESPLTRGAWIEITASPRGQG